MKKQVTLKLILLIFALQSASCIWIQVQDDVDYPANDFKAAIERIEKISAENPGREGVAEEINVMVYDGNSRDYVNLVIPVSLIEATKSVIPMDEIQAKNVGDNIDLQKLINNFWDMGPGLIVQVEDVESDTKVLVWLE